MTLPFREMKAMMKTQNRKVQFPLQNTYTLCGWQDFFIIAYSPAIFPKDSKSSVKNLFSQNRTSLSTTGMGATVVHNKCYSESVA